MRRLTLTLIYAKALQIPGRLFWSFTFFQNGRLRPSTNFRIFVSCSILKGSLKTSCRGRARVRDISEIMWDICTYRFCWIPSHMIWWSVSWLRFGILIMARKEDLSICLLIVESYMMAFTTVLWFTIFVCYYSLAFEFSELTIWRWMIFWETVGIFVPFLVKPIQ